jgi:hypothetical protein
MISFINPVSYKCLLGPQSKNAQIIGNIASWTVGKKHYFTNIEPFSQVDIDYIAAWLPANFLYLSEDNINALKPLFEIKKQKAKSYCINIENLNYSGRPFHGIRGAINKNAKCNFTIQDHFNDINDIKDLIKEWSEIMADKYWQNHAGKNVFFFANNLHAGCRNKFVYDNERLVAFATLCYGEYAPYIVRKTLFNRYPGLTDYVDDLIYREAADEGTKIVNLGQGEKGLADYKSKFPGAHTIIHYNGSIK